MFVKTVRFALGCGLVALILYAAELAVRDCPHGILVYDNCLWLWVRQETGLPQSKLLHVLALFIVGLGLLAGVCVAVRYVFPHSKDRRTAEDQ